MEVRAVKKGLSISVEKLRGSCDRLVEEYRAKPSLISSNVPAEKFFSEFNHQQDVQQKKKYKIFFVGHLMGILFV